MTLVRRPDPAGDEKTAAKREAAVAAARAEVRSGMVVGRGTGSSARLVLDAVARRIHEEGLQIRGVPTSLAAERQAIELGIPLTTLAEIPDVDIDGADEVDPRRALTKGAGGAMTREKYVAAASRRLVIVVDESKLVPRLVWPVPLEVLPFASPLVERTLRSRFPDCRPVMRLRDGAPYITDNGNHIIDVGFSGSRPGPRALDRALSSLMGVIGHGLFVGMQPRVYVAGASGVRVLG